MIVASELLVLFPLLDQTSKSAFISMNGYGRIHLMFLVSYLTTLRHFTLLISTCFFHRPSMPSFFHFFQTRAHLHTSSLPPLETSPYNRIHTYIFIWLVCKVSSKPSKSVSSWLLLFSIDLTIHHCSCDCYLSSL